MSKIMQPTLRIQAGIHLKTTPDRDHLNTLIKGEDADVTYPIGREEHHIFGEGDALFVREGPGKKGALKVFTSVNGMALENGSVEETEETIRFFGFNLNNWSVSTDGSFKDANGIGYTVGGGEEVFIPLIGSISAGQEIVWQLPPIDDPDFKQQYQLGFPLDRLTPNFRALDWRESKYIFDRIVLEELNHKGNVKRLSIPDHVKNNTLIGLNKIETAAFCNRRSVLMTAMRAVEVLLQRGIIDIVTTSEYRALKLKKTIDDIKIAMYNKREEIRVKMDAKGDPSAEVIQLVDMLDDLKRAEEEYETEKRQSLEESVFERDRFSTQRDAKEDHRTNSRYSLYQWRFGDPEDRAAGEDELTDEMKHKRNKVFWLANRLGLMGVSDVTPQSNTLIDDIIKTVHVGMIPPDVMGQYLNLFPLSDVVNKNNVLKTQIHQYLGNAVTHSKEDKIAFATSLDHIKRRVIGTATSHNSGNTDMMMRMGVIYGP